MKPEPKQIEVYAGGVFFLGRPIYGMIGKLHCDLPVGSPIIVMKVHEHDSILNSVMEVMTACGPTTMNLSVLALRLLSPSEKNGRVLLRKC